MKGPLGRAPFGSGPFGGERADVTTVVRATARARAGLFAASARSTARVRAGLFAASARSTSSVSAQPRTERS